MADKDSYEELNDEQQTEGDICDKPPPAYTISVKDPIEGMKQPFIQQPFCHSCAFQCARYHYCACNATTATTGCAILLSKHGNGCICSNSKCHT
eukprot:134015_1